MLHQQFVSQVFTAIEPAEPFASNEAILLEIRVTKRLCEVKISH